MHVTVAGKQVETGEALQSRVRDGLAALARKYFEQAIEANVTFTRARSQFACDINLKAGRGLLMRGEGEGADAHRAFESASEHIATRLRRRRRRFSDHPRPVEAEAVVGATVVEPAPVMAEPADAEGTFPPIVAEPPSADAMTVAEAAARLEEAGAPVLLFRDRGAQLALSLVYRRTDGCIGWIETTATVGQ